MEIIRTEVASPFAPPAQGTNLVVFSDDEIIKGKLAVQKHLQLCSEYALKNNVFVAGSLLADQKNLCLFLFDNQGRIACRQPAIHLSAILSAKLTAQAYMEVADTDLGKVALCVDADIDHPQTVRTAALKGAEILIAVRQLDPVDNTPGKLLAGAWNAAQTNNLYVISLTGASCTVTCPWLLTRAKDGYLVRRTSCVPTRFGLNMNRLREVRRQMPLLEQLNRELIDQYREDLRR